jgi:hypothetical protein
MSARTRGIGNRRVLTNDPRCADAALSARLAGGDVLGLIDTPVAAHVHDRVRRSALLPERRVLG